MSVAELMDEIIDATGYVEELQQILMKKQKAVWKILKSSGIKLLHTRSPVKQKMKNRHFPVFRASGIGCRYRQS